VVDERTGQVLREDGSAVPGLYAAGRTAAGICSTTYVSGLSLADCVFSGRRAVRSLGRPDHHAEAGPGHRPDRSTPQPAEPPATNHPRSADAVR